MKDLPPPEIKSKKIYTEKQEVIVRCKTTDEEINTGNYVQTEAWAIDINEVKNNKLDYNLLIRQYLYPRKHESEPVSIIAFNINGLKEILESCTGTLIGTKSGDLLTYSHQREQLIHELKDKAELLRNVTSSTESFVTYLMENIEIDNEHDDENNIKLMISQEFISLIRYLYLYLALEITERE